MKKRPSKKIVQDVQAKMKDSEKGNYTFRLNKGLVKRFKGKCKKEDIPASAVVEELIRDFLGE